MNKLITLGSLNDERHFEDKDQNGTINKRFKSLLNSFRTRNETNSAESLESSTSSDFRSHVSRSFLGEDGKQVVEVENVIEQFLKDELTYVDSLSNLNADEKFSKDVNCDVLRSNLNYIYRYVSDEFLPDLRRASKTLQDFVETFLSHKELFACYKTTILEINLLHMKREAMSDDFNMLKNHLIEYIVFFHNLQNLVFDNPELNAEITAMLQVLHDCVYVENELKAKKLIEEIMNIQMKHLEACSNFIVDIIPLLNNSIRYQNKSNKLIGKITEIYENEKLLSEDLKKNVDKLDVDVLSECFLKHSVLFELYVSDAKKDRSFKTAFCNDKNINENLFSIAMNHLFILKTKFSKLKEMIPNCSSLDEVLEIIHKTLQAIDHVTAVQYIFGQNINLDKFGNILLHNKFKVKCDKKEAYEAVVFLFELAIVFTSETSYDNGVFGYLFETFIYLEHLGFDHCSTANNQFKVYLHEKRRKAEMHTVMSVDHRHGDVALWKKTITDLLMLQVEQTKHRLSVHYPIK